MPALITAHVSPIVTCFFHAHVHSRFTTDREVFVPHTCRLLSSPPIVKCYFHLHVHSRFTSDRGGLSSFTSQLLPTPPLVKFYHRIHACPCFSTSFNLSIHLRCLLRRYFILFRCFPRVNPPENKRQPARPKPTHGKFGYNFSWHDKNTDMSVSVLHPGLQDLLQEDSELYSLLEACHHLASHGTDLKTLSFLVPLVMYRPAPFVLHVTERNQQIYISLVSRAGCSRSPGRCSCPFHLRS